MKEVNLHLQEEWRLNMENNLKIDRCEVMKLYESCIGNLSVHSIGQWLKTTTDGQYIVVPQKDIVHLCHAFDDIEDGMLNTIEIAKDLENWM
jgi:hypothetical protein